MRRTRALKPTVVTLLVSLAAPLAAEEWPRFRGPNGAGVSPGAVVDEPSFEDNLLWKTEVPVGHSSPVVTEELIFLTAVEDEKLYTLAVDRDSGRIQWRRQAPRPRRAQLEDKNNPASPTPASDGENVYVFFGEYGLLSYGPDGNERWRVPLGPFVNIRGMAASPVYVDGKVLLPADHDGGDSFLLALDAETGEEVWRADRSEFRRSFSTPAIHRPESGPAQVIMPGSFALVSYSLETGEELWRVGGLCWQPKAVPLLTDTHVYLNCQGAATDPDAGSYPDFEQALHLMDSDGDGRLSIDEFYPERSDKFPDFDLSQNGRMDKAEWDYFRNRMSTRPGLFAIRLGGRGDVTDTHLEWTLDRPLGNVPTPLLLDGVLYSIRNGGILTSVDASTGEIIEQGRLREAMGGYMASPVAADGKMFFLDELGTLSVVRVGADWESLSSLQLEAPSSSTPVIADGRLYVRTTQYLYCFGPS